MALLDILGTIMSGGVTGIIGTVATSYFELKKIDKTQEFELKKMDFELRQNAQDMELMKLEIDGKIQVSKVEADAAIQVADAAAFAKSYDADKATYATGAKARNSMLFIIVDFIRGLIRPAMTIYITIVVTMIYMDLQGVAKDPAQAMTLMNSAVLGILYVWTTITLWWFGTRQKSQIPGIKA